MTVLPCGGGKKAVTRLDRSDRSDRPVAPEVPEKCCLSDYPGESSEYPGVAQSIRANIQRIRDIDHKEVLE